MNHDEFAGLARALFEESDDALMILDPETGHVLDANAAAQRLTGLPPRAVIDTPISDIFRLSAGQWAMQFPMPARTVHLSYAEWGGLFRTFQGVRVPADVTFTRLNARPHPVALFRVRPVVGRGDEPLEGPTNGRLKQLVAAVPDCLWSATITARGEGRFRYLSPVVEKIAGRTADAIGKPLRSWRELIHADDRPTWDEGLERRRAGKSIREEYRLVLPDGSVRWVRDDARAVRTASGRSVLLYGVFADITAWRQAEAALRRMADLVDSAEDAIISQSTDGLIIDWNRGAERLYGYTKDEIAAKPVLRLFAPDGVNDYQEAVRRLKCGEPAGVYEATQVRKSGERIAVSMRISSIGNQANGISIIARRVNRTSAMVLGTEWNGGSDGAH
jgi:PAS domain S-box-containing protein